MQFRIQDSLKIVHIFPTIKILISDLYYNNIFNLSLLERQYVISHHSLVSKILYKI